jgi:hypothetical protein
VLTVAADLLAPSTFRAGAEDRRDDSPSDTGCLVTTCSPPQEGSPHTSSCSPNPTDS